jgi:hypothetical protein
MQELEKVVFFFFFKRRLVLIHTSNHKVGKCAFPVTNNFTMYKIVLGNLNGISQAVGLEEFCEKLR